LRRIPFIHYPAVVRSKVRILIRADASEIAESLDDGRQIEL
jgi:hypothetical protein